MTPPNIPAASQVILDFLVVFGILFSAIDAYSIQLTMLYKLKKNTSNYLSPLLVAIFVRFSLFLIYKICKYVYKIIHKNLTLCRPNLQC